MRVDVRVVATAGDLALAAATHILETARNAVQERGRFTIALSGGATPARLYSLLATDVSFVSQMPWAYVHVFWGDERHVPPDHADSNYRLAYETMLAKVPIPHANIHRVKGELGDAHRAAEDYARHLAGFFNLAVRQRPRFDILLLGLGADGHTASLFPDTAALADHDHLFVANRVPQLDTTRLTMTLPVLNNAACVIFLVSGADKTEILRAVLDDDLPTPYPAQLVRPANGSVIWFVTQDAAALR